MVMLTSPPRRWIPDFFINEAETVYVEVKPIDRFPDTMSQIRTTTPMRQEWRTGLKRYLSTTPYILLGILILAALLRLLHLGSESLWWDEIVTVAIVRLDWGTF